jgi:hypothetical protein
MRQLIVAAGLLGTLLLATPAQAQAPLGEVFLGGSFARNEGTNFGGWNTSVTGNFLPWLGVTGDFAGHYNSPVTIYTYTVGPRLSFQQGSGLAPFTQATFGGSRVTIGGLSESGFGMYIGGGLDWIARDRFAIRLMQLDAQLVRILGSNLNGTRISFGVILRLGAR